MENQARRTTSGSPPRWVELGSTSQFSAVKIFPPLPSPASPRWTEGKIVLSSAPLYCLSPSYYSDPETGCQLYHVCHQGNKFSQLCPNGTIFDQGQFACSNWRKVDCSAEALQLGEALVSDFAVEREFVTLNLDVSNPLEELPWRNRNS